MEGGLKRMISGIHKEELGGCTYHSTRHQSKPKVGRMRSRDRQLQLARAQACAPSLLRQGEYVCMWRLLDSDTSMAPTRIVLGVL